MGSYLFVPQLVLFALYTFVFFYHKQIHTHTHTHTHTPTQILARVSDLLNARAHTYFNPLTPNDDYSGRTAPLTSKRCILYIFSTNIDTEYFKHGIYSPFFPLQIAVCFINLTYLVPVLFTFYIQNVLKLKKNNSGYKRLMKVNTVNLYIYIL